MKKIFALIFAALITTTGCIHRHPHTKRTANLIDDKVINERVTLQLRDKGAGQFSNVTANTSAGVVTLRGTVFNPQAKSRAVQIASNVDDVKSVDATQVQVGGAKPEVTDRNKKDTEK